MGINYNQIDELEEKLGLKIDNAILTQAMTHTSYAHEQKELVEHNERLEFLGDAVLELAVSEAIFNKFSDLPEGELTKIRAELVCEQSLVKVADQLEISSYLMLGKGEEATGGRNRPSIKADAVEALFGAVFLEHGFEIARSFILDMLKDQLEDITEEKMSDFKTLYQELVQERCGETPSYAIVEEEGPEHDKLFTAQVLLDGQIQGEGRGKSKKESEQEAAKKALKKIRKEKR